MLCKCGAGFRAGHALRERPAVPGMLFRACTKLTGDGPMPIEIVPHGATADQIFSGLEGDLPRTPDADMSKHRVIVIAQR